MLKFIMLLIIFLLFDAVILRIVLGTLSFVKKFDEEAEKYFKTREKNRLYNEGDEDSLR